MAMNVWAPPATNKQYIKEEQIKGTMCFFTARTWRTLRADVRRTTRKGIYARPERLSEVKVAVIFMAIQRIVVSSSLRRRAKMQRSKDNVGQ